MDKTGNSQRAINSYTFENFKKAYLALTCPKSSLEGWRGYFATHKRFPCEKKVRKECFKNIHNIMTQNFSFFQI